MTSVGGAGFSSMVGHRTLFDPIDQGLRGPIPQDTVIDSGPEEKVKVLEKRVSELIEECVLAASNGNLTLV